MRSSNAARIRATAVSVRNLQAVQSKEFEVGVGKGVTEFVLFRYLRTSAEANSRSDGIIRNSLQHARARDDVDN